MSYDPKELFLALGGDPKALAAGRLQRPRYLAATRMVLAVDREARAKGLDLHGRPLTAKAGEA